MKKGLVLIVIILMINMVSVQANNPFDISVHVDGNIIVVDNCDCEFTFVLFTDKIGALDKTKPINPKDIIRTLELTGYDWQYQDLYESVSYEVKKTGLYTLIFTNKDNMFMIKQLMVTYEPDKSVDNIGQVVASRGYSSSDTRYLQPESLIESDDEEIIKLASELGTPYKMMDWIHSNIEYDYEKAKVIDAGKSSTMKYGAKETLVSKKGVCYDMSALLVAMCRAKGIPSLITCGAYDNKWHSWVMAFVDDKWVHIDPTSNLYNQIPEGYKLYGEYKLLY